LNLDLRKSIKALKDSESSLVCNTNLSKILPSSDFGPGPGSLSQNGQKSTWLTTSLTKKLKPPKFFFTIDSKTCRVFWGFEQLSSTINWPDMELQSDVKIAAHVGFLGMIYLYTSHEHVKWILLYYTRYENL